MFARSRSRSSGRPRCADCRTRGCHPPNGWWRLARRECECRYRRCVARPPSFTLELPALSRVPEPGSGPVRSTRHVGALQASAKLASVARSAGSRRRGDGRDGCLCRHDLPRDGGAYVDREVTILSGAFLRRRQRPVRQARRQESGMKNAMSCRRSHVCGTNGQTACKRSDCR